MTAEQQSKLRAILVCLGAEDLAMEVAAVADVRDLDANVRGAIIDVIGRKRHGLRRHEAVLRGLSRDVTPNQLGRELDEVADARGLDE